MPLKIMCAGCSKDERDAAEAMVKAALGTAAGSWMVSLVKIGRQWSVTIDGPEIKHKTMVVPDGSIPQALRDLVGPPTAPEPAWQPPRAPSTPAAMPRAPLPPTTTPPASRPAVPRPAAAPTAPTRAPAPPATPARTTPPTVPRPTVPAPARPVIPGAPRQAPQAPPPGMARAPGPPRSSPPTRTGVRQDRYDCQHCGGAFVVIYESAPDDSQETVAVACPHCWKNSHVMISEEAALTRDYRAEKV